MFITKCSEIFEKTKENFKSSAISSIFIQPMIAFKHRLPFLLSVSILNFSKHHTVCVYHEIFSIWFWLTYFWLGSLRWLCFWSIPFMGFNELLPMEKQLKRSKLTSDFFFVHEITYKSMKRLKLEMDCSSESNFLFSIILDWK